MDRIMERIYKVKIISDVPRCMRFSAVNGELLSAEERDFGAVIEAKASFPPGCRECAVEARWADGGFSFRPSDVRREYPIFSSELKIAVTMYEDNRSYKEISESVSERKSGCDRQRLESLPEMTYARAKKIPERKCPTFLGVPGNVCIWEAGFRGYPIEEKQHCDLYDYFIPRKNWDRMDFGADAGRVTYRYLSGRGMGHRHGLKRRNLYGYLPVLLSSFTENGILYETCSFCDSKAGTMSEDTGTNYLEADFHSAGHVLTAEQEAERIRETAKPAADTLLRVKLTAKNTSDTCRYAFFRLPHINTGVMAECEETDQRFKAGAGYYKDRIYMLAEVNGGQAPGQELTLMLAPGESAEILLVLFHSPVSAGDAKSFSPADFSGRLKAAERYWMSRLGSLKEWHLPEAIVDESVKTGYLHLLESCYGRKGADVFAAAAGVYSPIGSESSPIICFLDSAGDGELAGKCLNYFFDKEHPDGFMQNMTGYMLENGAVLYTAGLHYEYTRDEKWLKRNAGKIRNAAVCIEKWIERNDFEGGGGRGMIDGQVADPADTYRSYALNALAYAGLLGAAGLLRAAKDDYASRAAAFAEELKKNIIAAYRESRIRAPLAPLKNGEWVPAVAPWAEGRGAIALHPDGDICVTHASHVLKDSLLSLPFLIYYGVFDCNGKESCDIIDYTGDTYLDENVAYSQPYYSLVPLINLFRGERKAFLSEYYTAFAAIADRETHSFWEHYFLATPHKTHEQAWFLMRTRFMLYYEDGKALKLLHGIPASWQKRGKRIFLKDAVCRFGKFSLEVKYGSEMRIILNSGFASEAFIRCPDGAVRRVQIVEGENSFVFQEAI